MKESFIKYNQLTDLTEITNLNCISSFREQGAKKPKVFPFADFCIVRATLLYAI